MNVNKIFTEKQLNFPKQKKKVMTRMRLLCIFSDLFDVWKQLDFHIYFLIQSVVMSEVIQPLENSTVHSWENRMKKTNNVLIFWKCSWPYGAPKMISRMLWTWRFWEPLIYMNLILLNLLRLILQSSVWSVMANVPCASEKNAFCSCWVQCSINVN